MTSHNEIICGMKEYEDSRFSWKYIPPDREIHFKNNRGDAHVFYEDQQEALAKFISENRFSIKSSKRLEFLLYTTNMIHIEDLWWSELNDKKLTSD